MENKSFEEWIELAEIETSRTYHFPGGDEYKINHPQKVFIKKSGSHKLVDLSGKLHYIPPKWIAFSAEGKWAINVT